MPDPNAAAPEAQHGFRVLIVDDNRDCADTECAVLEALGYRCATAYDVHAAQKLADTFRPDVVLLDLGMPQNGFRVAEYVRSLQGRHITVIAVSGHGSDEARERAAKAGIALYMLKPVEVELLHQILTGIREKRAGGMA